MYVRYLLTFAFVFKERNPFSEQKIRASQRAMQVTAALRFLWPRLAGGQAGTSLRSTVGSSSLSPTGGT